MLTGTDTTLLEQRALFLRPDSALLVVLLSDEDDCSILDEPNRQGWLTGRRVADAARVGRVLAPRRSERLPLLHSVRAARFARVRAVGRLQLHGQRRVQHAGGERGHSLPTLEDSTNLRCFRQMQRFGLDFLYPVDRYVTGFTASEIRNSRGCDHSQSPVRGRALAGARSVSRRSSACRGRTS